MQAEPAVTPTHGAPWRPLAAITLAVLAAHLLVLQARPGAFSLGAPLGARPLVTRTIVLGPPPAAAAARAAPAAITEATAHNMPDKPAALTGSAQIATETIATAEPANASAEATPAPAEPLVPSAAPSVTPAAAPAGGARDTLARAMAFAIPGTQALRYRVTGEIKGQPYQASATLRWRTNGRDYEARLEAGAFLVGSREQVSSGRITPDGLAPTRFSDKSRSETATHFERDRGRISFSNNAPSVPLLAGAQDRLSVLIQLGAMVGGDPTRFGPETTITVQTASTREADQWLFSVIRAEPLQLPGGELQTLKLQRNPRREYDQKVEVWLAPELDYMPVRLRLTQPNGDFVDQQWLSTDKM